MSIIGVVKQLTGTATVREADGTIRLLLAGDTINEGDVIQTSDGSSIVVQLNDVREMSIGSNAVMAMDSSVVGNMDELAAASDDMQNALENGEKLEGADEETAAGEETSVSLNPLGFLTATEGAAATGHIGAYVVGSDGYQPYSFASVLSESGNNNQVLPAADAVQIDEPVTYTYSLAENQIIPAGFVLNADGLLRST